MNERIKELAEQANETVLLDIRGDGTIDKEVVFSKEKFAELIIQECIKVCENGYAGEFTVCGIKQCVSDLKNHFGVEE